MYDMNARGTYPQVYLKKSSGNETMSAGGVSVFYARKETPLVQKESETGDTTKQAGRETLANAI